MALEGGLWKPIGAMIALLLLAVPFFFVSTPLALVGGYLMGKPRGMIVEGLAAAFFLNFIGLIWLHFQPVRPKCPRCRSTLNELATGCAQCGADVPEDAWSGYRPRTGFERAGSLVATVLLTWMVAFVGVAFAGVAVTTRERGRENQRGASCRRARGCRESYGRKTQGHRARKRRERRRSRSPISRRQKEKEDLARAWEAAKRPEQHQAERLVALAEAKEKADRDAKERERKRKAQEKAELERQKVSRPAACCCDAEVAPGPTCASWRP